MISALLRVYRDHLFWGYLSLQHPALEGRALACGGGGRNDHITVGIRRGSTTNTDRFPTFMEVWQHAPPGHFLDFNSSESPL